MTILRDIGLWIWRVLPGNPILTRVVCGASKRTKHLLTRLGYLGMLLFVVMMYGGLGGYDASLAESAKKATQVFFAVSLVQLVLVSLIAPIFCAGAITQERDANTYNVLLTTPLSSGQIVLGTLFSRLYFVWVLLLSGLPVFCITMIFGGVTRAEVFQSFGLAACTGLITGSIAILISFFKVGTRSTIFYFLAGIFVYLLVVGVVGVSGYGQLPEATAGVQTLGTGAPVKMSWLAPVHPFLSLFVVTGQTPAPDYGKVLKYGWPVRWFMAEPQYAYMALTTLASLALVLSAMVLVRRSEQEGERTLVGRLASGWKRPTEPGEDSRKPRRVWSNPIAWREAVTRGSASGGPWVRWTMLGLGTIVGLLMLIAYNGGWWPSLNAKSVSSWLTAVLWAELGLVLFLVTITAASSLTREREAKTMEILLTTPLTSQYVCAGMLQGLLRYVVPLIAVPGVTLALFIAVDLIRGQPVSAPPEAIVLVPGLMLAFASTAAVGGLQASLLQKKTTHATMLSLTFVAMIAGILAVCGVATRSIGLNWSSIVMPFLPFPAVQAVVAPDVLVDAAKAGYGGAPVAPTDLGAARILRVFACIGSIAVYLVLTAVIYKNVVRNFDQIIRRQST